MSDPIEAVAAPNPEGAKVLRLVSWHHGVWYGRITCEDGSRICLDLEAGPRTVAGEQRAWRLLAIYTREIHNQHLVAGPRAVTELPE